MSGSIGKMMVALGLIIALLGGVIWISSNFTGLGRLPGDILIRKGNINVYIPITTSILISLFLSLLLWLFSRR
jgi:hypothetical protein